MWLSFKTTFNTGLFVFSKNILIEKGILSTDKKVGKLGFRVYPTWDLTLNFQAKKTQNWQKDYFLKLVPNQPVNLELAKKLLTKN